jgi:hypothetical protein
MNTAVDWALRMLDEDSTEWSAAMIGRIAEAAGMALARPALRIEAATVT